ncbi:uncharacterized protein LOC122849238 isoform X1 [Aphidius gifuensis]|uniref:uncharacterized protein LOC122849238 isoform X1 n=1 Tax=Aphidius gifuensis TaxID=684658 RepID=UPI001CDC92B3|nr:uncharacterized protein LOC122849238 isoform X1 [Aphidius gifuensis]
MSDTLKTIKATCGRNKYKLTLTSKNTLKLSDLKNVISNATGLSYQEEDGDDTVSVVPMIDGKLIIDPRVDILYTILIDTPMYPLANFNAQKSRKLMEIVKELAPPPPSPAAENSYDSDDSLMHPPKKIRKLIQKNKAPCGKKIVNKYITIRWIHYFFGSKNYG